MSQWNNLFRTVALTYKASIRRSRLVFLAALFCLFSNGMAMSQQVHDKPNLESPPFATNQDDPRDWCLSSELGDLSETTDGTDDGPSRTPPPGNTGNRPDCGWGRAFIPMSEREGAIEVYEGRGGPPGEEAISRDLAEQINAWLSNGTELDWFIGADS